MHPAILHYSSPHHHLLNADDKIIICNMCKGATVFTVSHEWVSVKCSSITPTAAMVPSLYNLGYIMKKTINQSSCLCDSGIHKCVCEKENQYRYFNYLYVLLMIIFRLFCWNRAIGLSTNWQTMKYTAATSKLWTGSWIGNKDPEATVSLVQINQIFDNTACSFVLPGYFISILFLLIQTQSSALEWYKWQFC